MVLVAAPVMVVMMVLVAMLIMVVMMMLPAAPVMVVMVMLLAGPVVAAAHDTPRLLHQLLLKGGSVLLHDLKELGSVDLPLRGGDDGGVRVEGPHLGHSLLHLVLVRDVRAAQDNGTR